MWVSKVFRYFLHYPFTIFLLCQVDGLHNTRYFLSNPRVFYAFLKLNPFVDTFFGLHNIAFLILQNIFRIAHGFLRLSCARHSPHPQLYIRAHPIGVTPCTSPASLLYVCLYTLLLFFSSLLLYGGGLGC